MKKRIVLCADDYGQAEPISKGILTLIQHGRLTATSCMVNSQHWPEHAKWLRNFKDKVDIGLHFNLTEGMALSQSYIDTYGPEFSSLSKVIAKSVTRCFKRSVIEAELNAQIDRFHEALGFMPNYVDGHQHVHQFPIIRQALINVYEQRLREYRTYVRLVKMKTKMSHILRDFKKIIIQVLGATALKQLLVQHHIPHNESFAGIYSFDQAMQISKIFPTFLAEIRDEGIIMCHPGLSSASENDPIAKARAAEYQYLVGSHFLMDCYKEGVILKRFREDVVKPVSIE